MQGRNNDDIHVKEKFNGYSKPLDIALRDKQPTDNERKSFIIRRY
jgi:hypothetical protein